MWPSAEVEHDADFNPCRVGFPRYYFLEEFVHVLKNINMDMDNQDAMLVASHMGANEHSYSPSLEHDHGLYHRRHIQPGVCWH